MSTELFIILVLAIYGGAVSWLYDRLANDSDAEIVREKINQANENSKKQREIGLTMASACDKLSTVINKLAASEIKGIDKILKSYPIDTALPNGVREGAEDMIQNRLDALAEYSAIVKDFEDKMKNMRESND